MDIGNLKTKALQNFETAEWAESKCYFDVSISRYYYSAYQKLIYISKNNGFHNEFSKKDDSHINNIKVFVERMSKKLTKQEKMEINYMKKLRKLRNKADYQEVMITI